MRRLLMVALAVALTLGMSAGPSVGMPSGGNRVGRESGMVGEAKPLPKLVQKWQGEKIHAADLVARGMAKARRDGRVRLPNGQFVDYALEGEDHIVTLLVEFTDPEHNQIAEPDRTTDNSTYWVSDFDTAHYEDMMFSDGGGTYGFPSMRDYYQQVSSGRYAVTGQVSNWLQIPQPESAFGANGPDGPGSDNLNGPVYRVVDASLQAAAASADDGIDWSPALVDVWDRYDCDGDGNYDEPDGYVDHLTIIHAGAGEEAGGGSQGGNAIWSHRWYANIPQIGLSGPAGCPFGGYQMPGTSLWVGDYTIEPENGGVGVLAHEFGHDLGLPDLYDRVGSNDNSISFWDLMSDGGWPSDDPYSLDTKPVHMGVWDKLVLGWLDGDLAVADLGDRRKFRLGPGEGASAGNFQALRVNLPDYEKTKVIFPPDGADAFYYYSGAGDDLDRTMQQSLAAPLAAPTPIAFRTDYDIETDWDYAYLEVSTDGGATFDPIQTNLSTTTNPNGQNFGYGITGTSGGWVDGSATLPTGTTDVGFRYWTDGAVQGKGFAVDSISIGGGPVDDATDPSAWTFSGFSRLKNGKVTDTYFHYYLVESRSYVRNDTSLCGAYLFVQGNLLEKQCYADGLLIWYRNSAFGDNDVSLHPGRGLVLVVDSHPEGALNPVGNDYIRERWQTWDSTFGFRRHKVTLHQRKPNGTMVERVYKAKPVSLFFDKRRRSYYDRDVPFSSVKTAGSKLIIELKAVSADRTTYKVLVDRA
ncbi:MAG TPA: immune inhibitor A domain-containing protein [Actinomycetota bacterium]|nr:immune inhibitor A domain-containing protein [Actinomycetota bacterium]